MQGNFGTTVENFGRRANDADYVSYVEVVEETKPYVKEGDRKETRYTVEGWKIALDYAVVEMYVAMD